MSKDLVHFAVLTILVTVVNISNCQTLPAPVCTYVAYLFRTEGCLENESPFCKMIGLVLTTELAQPVCPQFPCEGYRTSGHRCAGIFGCVFTNIKSKGLCPIGKVCCKV